MRHAVFTIVQDEPFFFPLWYKYYRSHYAPQHIYVLHHPLLGEETADPTWLRIPLAMADANTVRVFHVESFDHTWLRRQVEQFAAFLLGSNDTVTFTEADEIVAVDPTKVQDRSLLRWLDAWCVRGQPAARCTGYEVVHRFGDEPDVHTAEVWMEAGRVLKHRRWWYPSSIYSKTLTWRVPPRWDNGFHDAYASPGDAGRCEALNLPKEPELLLLHLHKVDYPVAVSRLLRTAKRNWSKADTQGRVGIQNRFPDEAQLREWWYRSIDNPDVDAALVMMPDGMRDIV